MTKPDHGTPWGLAFLMLVIAVGSVYVLICAWAMSPLLVVLTAGVGLVLGWRLRVASRRVDRAIAESTTRDGDADG